MEEENNMDGIEANIAKKMLKPATGFVEAILDPKIEKVRKWSENRELKKFLNNNEKLFELLENYIERMIRRASFISTIVFPQQKIPLQKVYVPIYTIERNSAIYQDQIPEATVEI